MSIRNHLPCTPFSLGLFVPDDTAVLLLTIGLTCAPAPRMAKFKLIALIRQLAVNFVSTESRLKRHEYLVLISTKHEIHYHISTFHKLVDLHLFVFTAGRVLSDLYFLSAISTSFLTTDAKDGHFFRLKASCSCEAVGKRSWPENIHNFEIKSRY